MKKHALIPFIVILLPGSLLFTESCKKDLADYGNITISMTDAPGFYLQVNVDIVKVRAHIVDNAGNGSWVDLPTNSGVYDLLALQNGIDTTIVNTTQLPAGTITQMRLVLGPNNTVMTPDSVVHAMDTPSGQQSGVKLVGHLTVAANQALVVLLDFVAGESVVENGNNTYHLKPVIKVLP